MVASECLKGLKLQDDWYVEDVIKRSPHSTGGCFSCGYRVSKNGKKAYLKAIDFSWAFSQPDPPRALQAMTEAYNFERDLLEKCKNNHLSKIVCPITSGKVSVPGFPTLESTVYYIIFEMADGDIRTINEIIDCFDFALIFRTMHNLAVALKQIHTINIAHQDIKPSNALVFNNETKLSDMGRSSDLEKPYVNDTYQIPGDRNYAPLEQMYNYHANNDFTDRFAADLYTFGSLFFFYFYNMSISQIMIQKAKEFNIPTSNNFEKDLPYWERLFDEVLYNLQEKLDRHMPKDDLLKTIEIIRSLCHPNPKKRGHKKNIEQGYVQYDMQRFITELNILAKKAEYKLI